MILKDVNEACNHRITEGSQYQWSCFGPKARFLDYEDAAQQHCVSAIYDTRDQRVYQLEVWIPGQDNAFRWHDPEFRDAYVAEAVQRGVTPDVAWDDVNFVLVESPTEILGIAHDVCALYYDNVPLPASTPA
jgi:hypothetical protein